MYGSAAWLILDAANEHGAGLIVMALVATPILRLLVGSVAHKVLYLSACPSSSHADDPGPGVVKWRRAAGFSGGAGCGRRGS
jgi:hypothetical protein